MTYYEAQKILNQQRYDGLAFSRFVIDAALFLTGDLEDHQRIGGSAMDRDVRAPSQEDREGSRHRLVAADLGGLGEASREACRG